MFTRGNIGGPRVVNKRPRQSRKKQCELGSGCPYQHEYQHQLEFAHDGNSNTATTTGSPTSDDGTLLKRGRKSRGGEAGGRKVKLVNGTGSRGRKVALAADRRRAERTLREGVGVEKCLLDIGGGSNDARDVQRIRWAMKLQQDLQHQQRPRVTNFGPGGADDSELSKGRNRSRTNGLDISLPSDRTRLMHQPSPSISNASSLSSSRPGRFAGKKNDGIESATRQMGERGKRTAEPKRAGGAAGTTNYGQRGTGSDEGGLHHREVICLDSDTDNE